MTVAEPIPTEDAASVANERIIVDIYSCSRPKLGRSAIWTTEDVAETNAFGEPVSFLRLRTE